MYETADDVYKCLEDKGIEYELFRHKAIFSVEDGKDVNFPHPEADAKNLFLRDAKKRNYYLLTLRDSVSVNLKALQEMLGSTRLSFASEKDLWNMLRLRPGSVASFGMLNDEEHRVQFLLDDYFENKLIGIHPNDNTATVYLQANSLMELIREHSSNAVFCHIKTE